MLLLNGKALHPEDIEFINVINGGNHGKFKFRFTVKLIVKMKNGEQHEVIYPIGDVKCKKDNRAVLQGTLLPEITDGVNQVAREDPIFYYKDGQ